jgi:hypothetical protein
MRPFLSSKSLAVARRSGKPGGMSPLWPRPARRFAAAAVDAALSKFLHNQFRFQQTVEANPSRTAQLLCATFSSTRCAILDSRLPPLPAGFCFEY